MMFRGGVPPQPVSNDSAVALIVDQLGLGLKQYQNTKRVQMLSNPLQYLKARNAAYTAVTSIAEAVYNGALYQIAQSVIEDIPATDHDIDLRATDLADNNDLVAGGPAGWAEEI